MTESIKRYEKETGDLQPLECSSTHLLGWYNRFCEWLVNRGLFFLSEYHRMETDYNRMKSDYDRAGETLLTQAEEIEGLRSKVKELQNQLTWVPMTVIPKDGKYVVQYKFNNEERLREAIFNYHDDRWWNFSLDVVRQMNGMESTMVRYLAFPIALLEG